MSWKMLEEDGWTYRLWTDKTMRDFIVSEYAWFIPQYDGYKTPIQRVDVWRYFALYHFGGLYVDLDIVCKRREFIAYFKMIEHEDVVLPKTKDGNGIDGQDISNCFMLSAPHSKFWPHVFDRLQDPYKNAQPYMATVAYMSKYYDVIFSTGPSLVSASYYSYPDKANIYVIPAAFVQPLDDTKPKPHSTRESIVKIIEGNSWHPKDVKFWKSFGFFSKYAKQILGTLLGCSLLVIVMLSVIIGRR
jgi:mannosyltransferase OCH1-like enzyme